MSNTLADAITYARQIAQTDSNGISDAQGLLWGNDGLQDATRELIKKNIDAAQVAESASTITGGVGAWPSDMFMLKTISVNTGSGAVSDYVQATKLDVSNLQDQTSVDWLRLNQNAQAPQFDNHGDTFEIFPNSLSLIKIFYYETPVEYSTTSSSIVYPLSLDYRALSCWIAKMYKLMVKDFDGAAGYDKEYIKRIGEIINILAPQSQQPTKPEPLHINGWGF